MTYFTLGKVSCRKYYLSISALSLDLGNARHFPGLKFQTLHKIALFLFSRPVINLNKLDLSKDLLKIKPKEQVLSRHYSESFEGDWRKSLDNQRYGVRLAQDTTDPNHKPHVSLRKNFQGHVLS